MLAQVVNLSLYALLSPKGVLSISFGLKLVDLTYNGKFLSGQKSHSLGGTQKEYGIITNGFNLL